MTNYSKINTIVLFILVLCSNIACDKDDVTTTNDDEKQTIEPKIELEPATANQILSKTYEAYTLSGENGPSSVHFESTDAGQSAFIRSLINLQDFSADGIKSKWVDDENLIQLTNSSNWNSQNKYMANMFNRVNFIIYKSSIALDSFKKASNIDQYQNEIAELRFLRSLSYFYLMDLFGKGNLPSEGEEFEFPNKLPEASRTELFNFIENELLAIETTSSLIKKYGHVNKHVIRMLLAKLYLNAEVYIGNDRYTDALKYAKLIIDEGGYNLDQNYVSLFSADNNLSTEIIFSFIADPLYVQNYGNLTFLINGSFDVKTIEPNNYGVNYGWSGHRATKAWYSLYNDNGPVTSEESLKNSKDDRSKLFWTTGHNYEMDDYKKWTEGYPSIKYRNTNFYTPSDSKITEFTNTDFPLYRLADVYLMYAECVVRGAGGDMTTALQYINDIRNRSNASTVTSIDLDFILDERARELSLEGHRRTDLIRFGKFTGASYVWPWKGGLNKGGTIPNNYNLFPIPSSTIQFNPNMTQNIDY